MVFVVCSHCVVGCAWVQRRVQRGHLGEDTRDPGGGGEGPFLHRTLSSKRWHDDVTQAAQRLKLESLCRCPARLPQIMTPNLSLLTMHGVVRSRLTVCTPRAQVLRPVPKGGEVLISYGAPPSTHPLCRPLPPSVVQQRAACRRRTAAVAPASTSAAAQRRALLHPAAPPLAGARYM